MEKIYRLGKNKEIIKGIGLPAFIHNSDYHQVLIKIYEDGLIDCWELVDFEGFKKKVESGWVVTQLPEGSEVSCTHLYYGLHNFDTYIEVTEFLKEVKDTIKSLQGDRTSHDDCIEAFEQYLTDPSDSNRVNLEKKYNAVPKHLQMYLLRDQDAKDYPIRHCIESLPLELEEINKYKDYYGYLFSYKGLSY
ncbi:MAG: hypothetical protein KAH22_11440 [Thiotrichaceae bacterium]|nr:hypothetical protein [Thiotrichaceae bacterium]